MFMHKPYASIFWTTWMLFLQQLMAFSVRLYATGDQSIRVYSYFLRSVICWILQGFPVDPIRPFGQQTTNRYRVVDWDEDLLFAYADAIPEIPSLNIRDGTISYFQARNGDAFLFKDNIFRRLIWRWGQE